MTTLSDNGVYYFLLPSGTELSDLTLTVDTDSFENYTFDNLNADIDYTYEIIEDWRDSGQDMIIVTYTTLAVYLS